MDTASTAPTSSIPSALTTSSTLPNSAANEQKTQFLRLLVAQLKGQNPLDPMDGTQFVTQLAQFSSVEELINIRTLLEGLSKAPTDAAEKSNPFKGA
jgi:flagellar basal-body rod modification protein FlgD